LSDKKQIKNVAYKIIRFLYENFIILLPILVGLNLFYQNIDSNKLTVYLFDSETKEKLYESKFEIYNEGNSISKYELIQPLIINLQNENSIVDFDLIAKNPNAIKVWFSKLKKNKLKVDFDLLNENENITLSILTTKPINKFTVSSRIKNIEEVITYHFKIKPKFYDRVGRFWYFLLFFSILTFVDAFILVSKNKQLNSLLGLIDQLTLDTDKKIFLEAYDNNYLAYKVQLKRNKDSLMVDILSLFNSKNNDNLDDVKLKMKTITKRSVLYILRKPYLLISPILFLVSILGIIFSLMYYATF
jgi:hypothetical protein